MGMEHSSKSEKNSKSIFPPSSAYSALISFARRGLVHDLDLGDDNREEGDSRISHIRFD